MDLSQESLDCFGSRIAIYVNGYSLSQLDSIPREWNMHLMLGHNVAKLLSNSPNVSKLELKSRGEIMIDAQDIKYFPRSLPRLSVLEFTGG